MIKAENNKLIIEIECTDAVEMQATFSKAIIKCVQAIHQHDQIIVDEELSVSIYFLLELYQELQPGDWQKQELKTNQ